MGSICTVVCRWLFLAPDLNKEVLAKTSLTVVLAHELDVLPDDMSAAVCPFLN